MKRSEMINIINNILQRNFDPQDVYYGDSVDILEAIEKAGMLPPETDTTDFCDCGFHNLGDLKWEEE